MTILGLSAFRGRRMPEPEPRTHPDLTDANPILIDLIVAAVAWRDARDAYRDAVAKGQPTTAEETQDRERKNGRWSRAEHALVLVARKLGRSATGREREEA